MMTCLCIKVKWTTLKSWLLSSLPHRRKQQRDDLDRQQQQHPEMEQYRRPSHCTSCSSRSEGQDRIIQTPPTSFCKLRSSRQSSLDLHRETEKVYDLYLLAMDEPLTMFALKKLNYAGDSQGTFYYVNDRVSAQEAIENFSNASLQLLAITHDPDSKTQLQAMIQARLQLLQTKFNALPEVVEDALSYRRSIYCS